MISGIIKVEVSVISRSRRLRLITLAETLINNGNRTEWSPIRSVIIRVINKIGRPRSGSPICYHKYDYRLNWTTRCPVTN